jgi:hypothetical protein
MVVEEEEAVVVLLFNSCLLTGHHSQAWKTAMIVVIPKPGRTDYTLPKNYRPVTLIECLSKLLEKIVAKCVLHNIGKHGLVPTNQFGAHPHSSTIHAGLALTHDITVAHMQGGCCTSLQFDIQGFFDNINHDHLIWTFHQLGFDRCICDWLKSFLVDRMVKLRFNGHLLDLINILVGAPQGSPISPVLSIVYTGDLLRRAEEWQESKMYSTCTLMMATSWPQDRHTEWSPTLSPPSMTNA